MKPAKLVLALLMLVGCSVWLWLGCDLLPFLRPGPGPGANTGSSSNLLPEPVKGSSDAPVAIIEFSDFFCPFCARFARETLPQLEEEYLAKGKAKLIFRNFPVHGGPSILAAEAAECAHEQGRFWDYHDELYAAERHIPSEGYLKELAAKLGLDVAKFSECLDSGRYAGEVADDQAAGRELGVRGTPWFFIDGREIRGAQPYEVFQEAIEEALAAEG